MSLSHPFLRFVLVGGLATAIHYMILTALYRWGQLNPVLSTSIGFVASAIFNFSANYRFTFRSDAPIRLAVVRYIAVASIGLLLNAGVFSALSRGAEWPLVLAQVVATGVVLVWNYLGGRHFIFRNSTAAAS